MTIEYQFEFICERLRVTCRVQVLAGFANAVVLMFVALNIVLEAGVHVMEGGHDVTTHRLLPVSVAGLAVNLIGLAFAHEAHHHHSAGAPRQWVVMVVCRPLIYTLNVFRVPYTPYTCMFSSWRAQC